MAQLSKVNLCQKWNQKLELIHYAREKIMKTLSCVDFAKLCHVIKYFPQLNRDFDKEDITFPLS